MHKIDNITSKIIQRVFYTIYKIIPYSGFSDLAYKLTPAS